MYTVILMAAMTTATATPDCGHGCFSSCYGGGYGGCYGGCYGSCYGGCYGGCYGSCYGGCNGGCYGCYGWGYSYGCHGCYGCWGCYGSCYGAYTTQMAVPVMPVAPGRPEEINKPKPGTESLVPAKAKLIVEIPADAKLFIDDQPMKVTTPVRQFNTPELQPGQTYFYMVRVEMMQDGAPQTVTRRILVRAGEQVTADFKDMKAPTASVATAQK